MQATGYKGITTLSKGLPYRGGICKWYYTPLENIGLWPAVNPLTQYLTAEPILQNGATWYGPVHVPNDTLGYSEKLERGRAGISYNTKIEGNYPGDSADSRVNLENMPYHRFAVVAQMRAGGLFLLIGAPEAGLQFATEYLSGEGATDAAGSKFAFTGNHLYKAFVLPAFAGANTTPAPGSSGGGSGSSGGTSGANDVEIIPFSNQASITIPWTAGRTARFGSYPMLQVWFTDIAATPQLVQVPILVDAAPPLQTNFIIDLTGNANGYVIIK